MSEWQPIETAPKDGTLLLVWFADGRIRLARWATWRDVSYPWVWQNEYGDALVRPWKDDEEFTRWMPLPEPPQTENPAP